MHLSLRSSAKALLPILGLGVALLLARDPREAPSFGLPPPRPAAPRDAADLAAQLEASLSVAGILEHMRALEAIARVNGGDRATGTAGYDASVAYVVRTLRDAGYEPELAELEYDHFTLRRAAEVAVEAASGPSWSEPAELRTLTHSGSGDVAGPLARAGSGCTAKAFADLERGGIALVERGGCTFAEKARLAHAAGAAALIVVPSGTPPVRSGPVRGSLLAPSPLPVVGATRAVGTALAARLAHGPIRLRARVDTTSERRRSASVLGETTAGEAREVVLLGAHLDSVIGSPGIDDNASSVGLLLELARLLAGRDDLAHRVRFAFWTGEEKRLLGSRAYVASLDAEERSRIALYLNFDMIASPNYARVVYDGDGTAGGAPWPEGSAAIERAFRDHFAARGAAVEERDLTGRSDHAAFVAAGIPSGGIASFARGRKTPSQAARYGGDARAPLQPCYHRPCDTLDRTSPVVLGELARAAASVVARFAGIEVPVPYARRSVPALVERSAPLS